MDDPHQVNAIIATAICDAMKDSPEERLGIEQAKVLAKQIVEALENAGLQINAIDSKGSYQPTNS